MSMMATVGDIDEKRNKAVASASIDMALNEGGKIGVASVDHASARVMKDAVLKALKEKGELGVVEVKNQGYEIKLRKGSVLIFSVQVVSTNVPGPGTIN